MKNSIFKINFLILFIIIFCFASGQTVLAISSPQVQTNPATNIQHNSVTFNGNLVNLGQASSANVWFQWGITTSYGNETTHQTINYPESFSFSISNLSPNTTFHFRAVAQNNYSTVYGADMTFTTGQSQNQQITVNAGPDLYVNSGQSVVLQGSGYDGSGNPVNYNWSCVGGTLSSSNIAQPTYTPPYISGQGTYTCTLTVSSNIGASNSDSIIVYTNYTQQTGGANVQTNSATNILSNQATVQGYFGAPYLNASANVWFQWGTNTNYGNNTNHQLLNNSGSFTKNITGLSQNTTYHFRAVAQTNFTTIYGSDMTFYTGSGSGSGGYLVVGKKAINLTSGNLSWQNFVNAKPGDILSFAITMQTIGQDVHNIFVQDILPANLIYRDNLTVNASLNYSGNPSSGINVGTLGQGQVEVISYQVQVASKENFAFGASTLTSPATITSQESATQNPTVSVLVNNSFVQGATDVPTGLANNFLENSFFLPLLIILVSFWLYLSGSAYKFADWIKRVKQRT